MRVQNIGQNYKSQKTPSFQAEGVFIKKCRTQAQKNKVYEAARQLADQLVAKKVPHTVVGVNSVNFDPYVAITVETEAKLDTTVMPMLEKFAKKKRFEKDIKPGCLLNLEALDQTARELVLKLKSK